MRFIHTRHVVATIAAAVCVAVPASASAAPIMSPTPISDAAQPRSTDRSDAAQSGSDVRPAVHAKVAFPPADFRGGDTPADFAGASRATNAAPTTIEVVRPERTIVRDVDEALPLIMSGAALLLVLAGLATTLFYARMVPRGVRTH